MKVSMVDFKTRVGYYLAADGEWRRDRRRDADRRADAFNGHFKGMRKLIRRVSDQEMLEFIGQSLSAASNMGAIEFLPQEAG